MKDFHKKSREQLFSTFISGAVFGLIDSGTFELGYLFGSGIGMMLICLPIGYLVYWIIGGKRKEDTLTEEVLDIDLATKQPDASAGKYEKDFHRFKYGFYASLFFLILQVLEYRF